jgi:hypothetical protein
MFGFVAPNIDCVDCYLQERQDPAAYKKKVTPWSPEGKLCIIVFSLHGVGDVGSAGICTHH